MAADPAGGLAQTVPATSRMPDWGHIYTEMHKKGVTLQLLHEEYLAGHPDGYRYSQFCELYRRYTQKVNLTMRQNHRGGEKVFVDFAGPTIPIRDLGGAETRAQLFVATLGASNYTFAEAVASQSLPDWIAVHNNMAAFFGGLPELVVPDNLKSAVTRSCRYEPTINRTYEEWARHNGCCIMPTRAAKPRDKAKVECAVLVAERWILAALRNQLFFSLGEVNQAIRTLLAVFNHKPFKKMPGCRESMFRELDQPALRPLPSVPCEYAVWQQARPNIDYHVAVHLGDKHYHYYSVPYTLVGQEVALRITVGMVKVYHDARRVACHVRSDAPGWSTTSPEHMPAAHRRRCLA
jgi:transposase